MVTQSMPLTGSYIFADEGTPIRVNIEQLDDSKGISFDVLNTGGIIPAIHWMECIGFEQLESVKSIGVSLVKSIEGDAVADYDNMVPTFYDHSPSTYNFILLSDSIKHPMSQVLGEFSNFLLYRQNDSRKRLLIKSVPSIDAVRLKGAIEDKLKSDLEAKVFYSHRLNNEECPLAIYAHFTSKLSKGLRKRLGINGYDEVILEDKILVE